MLARRSLFNVHVGTAVNVTCSYVEIAILLFPGIPLTVLDDVPVATVDPLPSTPTLLPGPPECVPRYAQYLKDKYKRMSTLPDGDWPPSLGRQYTQLAMIEQERELPGAELVATMERDYIHGNIDNIVKRKKPIQLPEMFLPTENGGQQLKILMDGAPGVGKSTLSRKVCKDWASGELLQQYHLVILLALRQPSIREANSIEDLIKTDSPGLQQQVVHHIQETSGEHVLLILDGYDELSNEDRTYESLFLDIVRGNKFPKCSVLVTSRPYASDYLQQLESVNRHVEVLGFTKEQIEHCIMENIPDKAKSTELVQSLKERQDIVSLCYIPLNCAIVLYVYKMAQFTLPNSLTKLYEIFILNALRRHVNITGNDLRSIRRLKTLSKPPEPLQQQLGALSKLAYNGLVADTVVFSTDDLEAAFPDCSDLDIEHSLLGLMTVFKEFTTTGDELSYQFLHLTIQEFLAARWAASQLSADLLLKFFQDHLREDKYRMVLLFLAGISRLNFPSTDHLFQGTLDFNSPSHINKASYFFFLAHLIYESQNFTLFHDLASAIVGEKLYAAWYSISPFDSLVLAHFLAWCDCSLKLLDLSYCGLTSQSLEIMHRVNLEHCGTTQIEQVNLSYNDVITKLSLLSTIQMFEHTKVFIACGLQSPEGTSCVVDLLCILNMRHLTTLDISVKVGKICLSLDKFQCQNGNIESQNAVEIFRSVGHNTSLKQLDLSWNSQLAEGDSEAVGCALERMLNMNRTLKVLNLCDCGLKNVLAISIFRSLESNTSLKELDLSWNRRLSEHDSEAVGCAIERMLNVNRTLKVLNLCDCGLENVLAISVFRSLESNNSLKELDLSWNRQLAENDSEAVGCSLERMLNMNKTLEVLHLCGCIVTEQMAEHILTGVTKNMSLLKFNIEQCILSGSCAVSLLQQVTTHYTLSRVHVNEVDVLGVGKVKMEGKFIWCVVGDTVSERCVEFFRALNDSSMKVSEMYVRDLTDQTAESFALGLVESQTIRAMTSTHNFREKQNISSAGAVSIFRSLEHNTSLEELDLSGNSQLAEGNSEAVGSAIERMLNVNRTLKILNLSVCNITDPIVQHILTGLTKNTSLVTLDVRSSKLSVSCAVSLFQQMTTHPTVSITVGEVNVLGVGRVDMDRGTLWCVMSDLLPENCMEFFRALNNSGLKVSKLIVEDLTDKTAEHFAIGLAECQSVQALKLEFCNITSTGAVSIFRSLEHNTSLEELDLSGNSQLAEGDSETVGCAIERMLNVNIKLKVLKLSSCQVTDAIAKHIVTGLKKNTSLVTLDMGSSTLSGSGAVSFFQQMTTHPTLSVTVGEVNVLGVGRVKMDRGSLWWVIGDLIPEKCVEFFRALNNSDLKVSNLNVQDLTDQTAEHFAVGLSESQSVQGLKLRPSFSRKKDISSVGAVSVFRSLEHNTSLEELDLSGNSQLAEGDSEAVGCAIERMLNVNRTLKILNLSVCNITDPIVQHILTGLTKNTSLVTLDMRSSKLSVSCAVSLFQQMTTHPTVSITVGEVKILGVGRVKMDRESLWWVIGDLIPEKCVEFFRALNNSDLKVSNLNVQDLTDQTAEHFAVGLSESQSVQGLKLRPSFSRKKDISSVGAVSVFRSLEHNTSLEELDLSGNSQLAEGDSEAVGCAIERMLKVNRTLKVLNLSCGLGTTVVTHTAAGLAHNASLAELNIERNNFGITSEWWVHLFNALCNNTSLKKLDISYNMLGTEGSVALVEMLSCNKSLTELNLRWCGIPEAGLREIARGLLQNTSLQTLNIWSTEQKALLEAEMETQEKWKLHTPELEQT